MKEYIIEKLNRQYGNNIEQKIYNLESNDRQFLSILSIYKKIDFLDILKGYFLNSFITFQLSGYGEDWWEEFALFLLNYYDLYKFNKIEFWEYVLKNCKNNKRLFNLKIGIIRKNLVLLDLIDNNRYFYDNMDILYKKIVDFYGGKYLKTISFSIKMFGYVSRIKYGFKMFPYSIPIPLDSRIIKFYSLYFGKDNKKNIINYFFNISKELNIPPLHIDSIIWINQ